MCCINCCPGLTWPRPTTPHSTLPAPPHPGNTRAETRGGCLWSFSQDFHTQTCQIGDHLAQILLVSFSCVKSHVSAHQSFRKLLLTLWSSSAPGLFFWYFIRCRMLNKQSFYFFVEKCTCQCSPVPMDVVPRWLSTTASQKESLRMSGTSSTVSDALASSLHWKIMASKDFNAVMARGNETPPKTLQNRDFQDLKWSIGALHWKRVIEMPNFVKKTNFQACLLSYCLIR